MKLFKLFKKEVPALEVSKKELTEKELEFTLNPEETVEILENLLSHNIESVKDGCKQIKEAEIQVEEAKIEYEAVTSYLTDMQRIEQLPKEERSAIDEAGKMIVNLSQERMKYQKEGNIFIGDHQFKTIQKYEDILVDEMKKIQGYEAYQNLIKSDLRHLEGEKGVLLYEKEEIINQQAYLKKIAMITFILVGSLFLLFSLISYVMEASMQLPFLLTIMMSAIGSLAIFAASRKNQYQIKIVEGKLNRAILLTNRVKIKYINNTNCMEYAYSKFQVNSAKELSYLWEQYTKAKEQEKRYKKNTELLNYYNEVLIQELKRFHIVDPDVWIYQAAALVDQKEMVEIRHRLNKRRQRLRERIEYNSDIKEKEIEKIKKYLKKEPGKKQEIYGVLEEFRIVI